MLVLRVQHKETGLGPYRAYHEYRDDLCSAHNACKEHPIPLNDIGLDGIYSTEQFCGFESDQSMINWFYGWFKKLHEAGFELAIYDVDNDFVEIGQKQVLFRLNEAVLLEKRSLLSYDTHDTVQQQSSNPNKETVNGPGYRIAKVEFAACL